MIQPRPTLFSDGTQRHRVGDVVGPECPLARSRRRRAACRELDETDVYGRVQGASCVTAGARRTGCCASATVWRAAFMRLGIMAGVGGARRVGHSAPRRSAPGRPYRGARL